MRSQELLSDLGRRLSIATDVRPVQSKYHLSGLVRSRAIEVLGDDETECIWIEVRLRDDLLPEGAQIVWAPRGERREWYRDLYRTSTDPTIFRQFGDPCRDTGDEAFDAVYMVVDPAKWKVAGLSTLVLATDVRQALLDCADLEPDLFSNGPDLFEEPRKGVWIRIGLHLSPEVAAGAEDRGVQYVHRLCELAKRLEEAMVDWT